MKAAQSLRDDLRIRVVKTLLLGKFMKLTKQFMIILLLYSSVQPLHAEHWRCSGAEPKRFQYTNRPVQSSLEKCERIALEKTAFNVVKDYEHARSTKAVSETDGTRVADRPRLKPTLVKTSSKAKEFYQKGGNKSLFDLRCRVSGSAKSSEPGRAIVIVTRGALTIDELPVRIKQANSATNWEIDLHGRCRRPIVEIRME